MDSGVKELDLGHRNCVDCVKDYDKVWVPMWLVEGIERNEVTFLSIRASKVLLDWAKSLGLTYPWASRACWWWMEGVRWPWAGTTPWTTPRTRTPGRDYAMDLEESCGTNCWARGVCSEGRGRS